MLFLLRLVREAMDFATVVRVEAHRPAGQSATLELWREGLATWEAEPKRLAEGRLFAINEFDLASLLQPERSFQGLRPKRLTD